MPRPLPVPSYPQCVSHEYGSYCYPQRVLACGSSVSIDRRRQQPGRRMIPQVLKNAWDRFWLALGAHEAARYHLPVVAVPQRRQLNIWGGLMHIAALLVVSSVYYAVWCTAERTSMMFAPVAQVVVVHVVYLAIYALEYCRVIRAERCDSLVDIVEGLCFVGNLFVPPPPPPRRQPRPRSVLAVLWARALVAWLRW